MTGRRQAPCGYFTQDELSKRFGMSRTWLRVLRSGRLRIYVPFPAPDKTLVQKNRVVPLWRRDRLPELENWHRQHVQARDAIEVTDAMVDAAMLTVGASPASVNRDQMRVAITAALQERGQS
jgi:hypothetical protein